MRIALTAMALTAAFSFAAMAQSPKSTDVTSANGAPGNVTSSNGSGVGPDGNVKRGEGFAETRPGAQVESATTTPGGTDNGAGGSSK